MNGGWGSDGQFQTGMALGRKLGEVGLRGGGSWRESDGYRKNSSYEGKNAFLGWHIGERGGHEWSGRFTYSDVEAQFPGPLTYEQFQTDPRQSTNGGKDFSRSEDWQATASGEGQAALGKWQVKGGLLERMRRADLEGVHTDNRQRQGTLSPRIRKDLTGGFLIAGADLAYDQVDFMEFLGEEREINRALADIWRVTVGGYLFGSSDIGQGWTLSGGLRLETAGTDNDYRRFKEEQLSPVIETNRATVPNPAYRNPPEIDPGESFSGRVEKSGWAAELSLMHKLSDGLHVWGGWDRVYRYPALDETAAYQGFPLSDPLNEELDPETGNNFEIGIKRFESNWHASASVFLLLLDDEISFNEEERLNINIGNTERKGIEIETGYRQYRYGIVFHGSLVEAGFRDPDNGGDLPLVPSVEASATVWVKPVSEVRLQVSARYLSSQVQGNDFGNSFRRIPAYGIVDVSFQWNPTPHVALSGGIDNIFDRKHAVAAYSGGFYPGSGRQAHIRLKYVF
jgi:iron complex outermembrane receptor protein